MKLKLTVQAELDLDAGCEFDRSSAPNLAEYFFDSISADLEPLRLFAGLHAQSQGWHDTFGSRFPFVIWYGIKDDPLRVDAVLDVRSDPAANDHVLRTRLRSTT